MVMSILECQAVEVSTADYLLPCHTYYRLLLTSLQNKTQILQVPSAYYDTTEGRGKHYTLPFTDEINQALKIPADLGTDRRGTSLFSVVTRNNLRMKTNAVWLV